MSKKETKIGEETTNDIVIRDPQVLKHESLPLVITLPEGSSVPQVEYAKILNSYAYQNPEKWQLKKDVLIKKLRDLKDVKTLHNPTPNLTVGTKNVLPA